jgi:hypothetical protein
MSDQNKSTEDVADRVRRLIAWKTPGGPRPAFACPAEFRTLTLALGEIERLATERLQVIHECDCAVEDVKRLAVALERIAAHCGEIRGGAPPHVWIPALVRESLKSADDVTTTQPEKS